MATHYSPKIVTDGLVFCLDAASRNGISALGCGGFNGAPQLVKNMVSPSDVIGDFGGVKLGNLTYYTAFAIDYPEYSYGGDAAGRQGITPGYNVRSGTKTYDASRALHLYAWNNATSAWIEGEFNGARFSGHCYDNYTGAETGYAAELAKFVTDYNNIKTKYPDASFVVIGSHRADRYSQAVRDILTDLGKPAGYIDSDYIAAPEWILIGKPGLGAGNYYGWAYENYATNPSQVAHLNFGLPLFGSKNNYFLFDGVDDYFSIPNSAAFNFTSALSIEAVVKFDGNSDDFIFEKGDLNTQYSLFSHSSDIVFRTVHTDGIHTQNPEKSTVGITNGQWVHIVGSWDGATKRIYINGVLKNSMAKSEVLVTTSKGSSVGRFGGDSVGYFFNGAIAKVAVYNIGLSSSQILSNYNAVKGRFGL